MTGHTKPVHFQPLTVKFSEISEAENRSAEQSFHNPSHDFLLLHCDNFIEHWMNSDTPLAPWWRDALKMCDYLTQRSSSPYSQVLVFMMYISQRNFFYRSHLIVFSPCINIMGWDQFRHTETVSIQTFYLHFLFASLPYYVNNPHQKFSTMKMCYCIAPYEIF